ncbi:MAG: hypothetical protein KAT81_04345, partial [Syntrophobacterales bacterium]|nr:hypothetical protein [Syntrophobacterales bacterium]
SMQRQIFGTNILAVPKIACINCHPAKLPKYRGFWPILLAMINGDEPIGVTVHTMTKKSTWAPNLPGEHSAVGAGPMSSMNSSSLAWPTKFGSFFSVSQGHGNMAKAGHSSRPDGMSMKSAQRGMA